MAEEEVIDRGDVIEPEDDIEGGEDTSPEVEEEEEEEAEEEPEEEEEAEEEVEEEDGNQRIPRSRLNQVIQQRDEEKQRSAWLEDQLETLIKQRQAPEVEEPAETLVEYDFDSSESKYIELVLEGSIDDAGKLRREINTERDKIYSDQLASVKSSLSEEVKTSSAATAQDAKFEDFLDDTFSSKGYLDDASDDYNEQAVQMANRLMVGYMQEGVGKLDALDQAVKDIEPIFEKPKESLGKKTSKRATEARKKASAADDNQPPSTERRSSSKSARDLDEVNIGKMSEKDFNSLTKKELAVLRGDV